MLSCQDSQPEKVSPKSLDNPEHWKRQVLEDVLPYWRESILDSANGSFYTTMDENWNAASDSVRFPSMIARHLFSYASAYLLSGKESDIEMADRLYQYLIRYAWDETHGGWYSALNPSGSAVDEHKSTFVQVYMITGLAMYYFVTKDAAVYEYIQRSNALLEEKAWDPVAGGYFDNLNRDWTLQNDNKSFSSQLAPVSGYLLYLHLATCDDSYLRQVARILDRIMKHMLDQDRGWILEEFDGDWNYTYVRRDENEINVGHNTELAWMLARAFLLNGNEAYRKSALELADSIRRFGLNAESGIWYAGISRSRPELHSDFTYWWIQAYGLMMDLCLTSLGEPEPYVQSFLKGADFWENHFMDRARGDSHLAVSETGEVTVTAKANQFKSSYHNVEHGLLNYLYLSAWVAKEPVQLHFRIREAQEGDVLYPLPIEVKDYTVGEVLINGKAANLDINSNKGIELPALHGARVSVEVLF